MLGLRLGVLLVVPLTLKWLYTRARGVWRQRITHRKLPLRLPQRLDAVVVRHAPLKHLGAHEPVLGRLAALATSRGALCSRVGRHGARASRERTEGENVE